MKHVIENPERAKRLLDTFSALGEELRHQVIELDISSSMADTFPDKSSLAGATKLAVAKALLREEAARREPVGPLFGLAFFHSEATMAVPIGADISKVLEAVEQVDVYGSTCVREAIRHGLAQLNANPSVADLNHLIVVTDAEDVYSTVLAEDDVAQAQRARVTVDAILICPRRESIGGAADGLNVLASRTGGRFVVVHDAEGLQSAFREIAARPIFLLT